MALNLTTEQRALLRRPDLRFRLLTTWYMDDGTHRLCEDVEDITIDGVTWLGASALASVTEIKSGSGGTAAEPIKFIIDGTRMFQAGFEDPAEFFRTILSVPLSNRLVDLELAIAGSDSETYTLKLPLFSGKINYAKMVDPAIKLGSGEQPQPNLEILLDSLAMRYSWVTGRVRNHQDQLEIDPTDNFFSFTHGNLRNEQLLYWGKKAPNGQSYTQTSGLGGSGSGGATGGISRYDTGLISA